MMHMDLPVFRIRISDDSLRQSRYHTSIFTRLRDAIYTIGMQLCLQSRSYREAQANPKAATQGTLDALDLLHAAAEMWPV